MATVTINFPDQETINSFIGWFCDGGGEQYYMDVSEDSDYEPINNFNYLQDGLDWFIAAEHIEEEIKSPLIGDELINQS